MAVVVLASATGAPGVTTSAVGLSLIWPRHVLLADCDRDPSQAVQAGFLAGADTTGAGLPRILQAHRERQPLEDILLGATVALAAEQDVRRLYLPGFTHPKSAELFASAWPDLAAALRHLDRIEMDVIVDAGRIGAAGLPAPLLADADLVLVCVRSSLRSLAATRLHLPGLTETIGQLTGHAELGLLLVGEGRPYAAREIAAQFGVPVLATLGFDPAAAAVLSDGAERPRRFDQTGFARSLRTTADALSDRIARTTELIRGGTR